MEALPADLPFCLHGKKGERMLEINVMLLISIKGNTGKG